MLIPKTTYIRDEKHRRFIADLPCLITLSNQVQCAHIRKGTGGGMALKPSDKFSLPLSVEQHRLQGEIGEVKFWAKYGGHERAIRLAQDLYAVTGDREKALELIMEWKNEVLS